MSDSVLDVIRPPGEIEEDDWVYSTTDGFIINGKFAQVTDSMQNQLDYLRVLSPAELRSPALIGGWVIHTGTSEVYEVNANPWDQTRIESPDGRGHYYYFGNKSDFDLVKRFALHSLPESTKEEPSMSETKPTIKATNGRSAAVMPNGRLAGNAYEAYDIGYEAAVKAERDKIADWVSKQPGGSEYGIPDKIRSGEYTKPVESPPLGSWENPCTSYDDMSENGGWYKPNSAGRQHYIKGEVRNGAGPHAVDADGTRYWDNGTKLTPGIYSDDVPGGGKDAPWAKGYEE